MTFAQIAAQLTHVALCRFFTITGSEARDSLPNSTVRASSPQDGTHPHLPKGQVGMGKKCWLTHNSQIPK